MSFGAQFTPWGDTLQDKIGYTFPEGDSGVIQDSAQFEYRAPLPTYTAGQLLKIDLNTNGMGLDPATSYIKGTLKLRVVLSNGQAVGYNAVVPTLPGGIQDLFKDIRTRGFNGIDFEYNREYNQYHEVMRWIHVSPTQERENIAQMDLRGDCLTESEKMALMPWTRPTNAGAATFIDTVPTMSSNVSDAVGLPFIVKLDSAGFWNSKRYVPLRYQQSISIEIQLEQANRAFHCLVPLPGNLIDGTANIDPPSSGTAATQYSVANIIYELSDVSFFCNMVQFSPGMELALKQTVEQQTGLPIFFNTYEVQKDVMSASSFTQRITKGVANAVHAITILQLSSDLTDYTRDSFASEPFGLEYYRYRLGTKYFPDQPVRTKKRMLVEAERVFNFKGFNMAIPPSTITERIGADRYDYGCGAAAITAASISMPLSGRYGGSGDSSAALTVNAPYGVPNTNVMAYLNAADAVPSRFYIAALLQATPQDQLSGVATNHGNQLQVELNRYNTVAVPKTLATDTTNVKATSRACWGVQDTVQVTTFLVYTRVLLVEKDFNAAIRE